MCSGVWVDRESREFIDAAHETQFAEFGRKAATLVESCAPGQAIKLDVANAGKDGMRGDVRHEIGAEPRRTVVWMNDYVEHESLEDAVCEDAGESQKLLRAGCCDGENEVRMLEHHSHVREGVAHRPPLALRK